MKTRAAVRNRYFCCRTRLEGANANRTFAVDPIKPYPDWSSEGS
jgi:hypothetical protein